MKTLALPVLLLSAGSLITWHWLTFAPPPSGEPLIATPDPAVVDGSGIRASQSAQAVFTLTNRSERPITITEVRHCCGKVPLKDLRAYVFRPGESLDLPVQFDLPEAGVSTAQIDVVHDGSRVPVELKAQLVGRRALPYIVEKSRPQVAFLELQSIGTFRSLRVSTCEGTGLPWLGTVSCDLPGITVEPVGMEEQRAGAVFTRFYEYRVGWAKMPESREFYGELTAKTTYGDLRLGMPAAVPIGKIAGTRACEGDFTPKTARLRKDGNWSDAVVFPQQQGAGRWQLRSGWAPPPWLFCEWDNRADRQILRLSLRGRPAPGLPTRSLVPLINGGRAVELPVETD